MSIFRIILLVLLMTGSSVFAQPGKMIPKTIYSGLQNPTSFHATQNEIFIVEQGEDRVLKLDLEGNLLDSYGNKGSGDYQFNRPLDVDATNGLKIYVSDTRNNRIQVFDKRWQLLSSISGYSASNQNQRIEPKWLGVTKLGHLIFLNKRSGYLVKMDEHGTFLDEMPVPKEVKEVSKMKVIGDSIFILDNEARVIHQLSDSGFYETFYSVEDSKTSAFYIADNDLWTATKGSVVSGEKRLNFEESNEVQDIFIQKSNIYLLTDNKVLLFHLYD